MNTLQQIILYLVLIGAPVAGVQACKSEPPPIGRQLALHQPPTMTPKPCSRACRGTPTVTPTPAPSTIVIHVDGAVGSPGLYTLPEESRIMDAISAAGGFSDDAQQSALNLADWAIDGSKIYVPTTDETVQGSASQPNVAVTMPLNQPIETDAGSTQTNLINITPQQPTSSRPSQALDPPKPRPSSMLDRTILCKT